MPFANHRRLIAGFLQQFGERLLSPIKLVAVDEKPVEVRVLAGLDHGAHGAADAVRHIAMREQHALASQTVNVWSLIDLRPIRSNRLVSVIVREDEQDVRLVRCLGAVERKKRGEDHNQT